MREQLNKLIDQYSELRTQLLDAADKAKRLKRMLDNYSTNVRILYLSVELFVQSERINILVSKQNEVVKQINKLLNYEN